MKAKLLIFERLYFEGGHKIVIKVWPVP